MNSTYSEIDARQLWQRRCALLAATVFLGVFWCGVLPWVAAQPKMQQQLEFLDDRGIDPSAMFYTELDVMDEILEKSKIR